jgi:Raf kinase inhibitor-like YbhB/YbcL family protein
VRLDGRPQTGGAQPRHQRLERVTGIGGLLVRPQIGGKLPGGDDTPGLQGQQNQQDTQLATAHSDGRPAVIGDCQGTEQRDPYLPAAIKRGASPPASIQALRSSVVSARNLAAIVLGCLMLSGCGFLRAGTMVAPTQMTVSSEVFAQGMLPVRFTCHGGGISPPVTWAGAPAQAKSFALVVDDASAPISPYIYWLVFNIGPTATDIQEGQLPPDAEMAQNSAGTARYDPPCPQGAPHTYRVTVYALDRVLTNLQPGAPVQQAWTEIAAATIGRGRIPVTANP